MNGWKSCVMIFLISFWDEIFFEKYLKEYFFVLSNLKYVFCVQHCNETTLSNSSDNTVTPSQFSSCSVPLQHYTLLNIFSSWKIFFFLKVNSKLSWFSFTLLINSSSMDRLGNSSQASLSLCLLSVNKWLILLSTSPDRSENPVLQISKSIW